MIKKIQIIMGFLCHFGLRKGGKYIIQHFLFLLNRKVSDKEVKIKIPEILKEVYLRLKTSDFFVLNQIFVDKDYDFPINISPKLIIDAGANTGLASVFFASKFPEAQIMAIEPDSSNFEIMQKNISSFKNIKAYKSGIWNKDTYLKVRNTKSEKWSFIVEEVSEQEENSFLSLTINTLLQNSGFKEIDILKIDIEGSEKEVFTDNYEEWLSKVNILIIELHDYLKEGCSNAFYEAINKFNFTKYIHQGENLILIKEINI